MPKGYMISAHRSPADPVKGDAYRAIAIPAMKAMGGKSDPKLVKKILTEKLG